MTRPVTLILAETALETVPSSIRNHPAVQASVKRKKRPAEKILLDTAIHHHAMKSLSDPNKRGRPDILHICLLLATSSPLYRENLLNIIVHTQNDQLIIVNPMLQWRPPKNYNRFCGLMEQLLSSKKRQVPETGVPLLALKAGTLKHLREQLRKPILLFTEKGEYCSLSKKIQEFLTGTAQKTLTMIIGAFPRGDFSPETIAVADHLLSISKETFEAWTVVSRAIYDVEKYFLP